MTLFTWNVQLPEMTLFTWNVQLPEMTLFTWKEQLPEMTLTIQDCAAARDDIVYLEWIAARDDIDHSGLCSCQRWHCLPGMNSCQRWYWPFRTVQLPEMILFTWNEQLPEMTLTIQDCAAAIDDIVYLEWTAARDDIDHSGLFCPSMHTRVENIKKKVD